MYNEQIRNLRNESKYALPSQTRKALIEAANIIEKLSYRETPMRITKIHMDEYYCPACGAENNCDQGYVQDIYCPACGQRLLQESPKEEN